jgi:hypothetical protein
MEKEKKQGGKRKGAGRPKGAVKTRMTFTIDNELIIFLQSKKNQSEFVNNLIRIEMKKTS